MRVRFFDDLRRAVRRSAIAVALAGLLALGLAGGAAAQDIASAGNGGIAFASANGGAVSIGNVNSGFNTGNVIVVGNTGHWCGWC